MRYKGITLIAILLIGVLVARIAFAGGENDAVPTVSSNPVSVGCKYAEGVTSVRVIALSNVSNVVVYVGGHEYDLADALPPGWAATRTISGKFVSGTVSYDYRGTVETLDFVCN